MLDHKEVILCADSAKDRWEKRGDKRMHECNFVMRFLLPTGKIDSCKHLACTCTGPHIYIVNIGLSLTKQSKRWVRLGVVDATSRGNENHMICYRRFVLSLFTVGLCRWFLVCWTSGATTPHSGCPDGRVWHEPHNAMKIGDQEERFRKLAKFEEMGRGVSGNRDWHFRKFKQEIPL